MILTDNIRLEFNLLIPKNSNSIDNILEQPIIVNGNPVGIIIEAEIDDSKQFYKCKGVIWDRFIKPEFFVGNTLKLCGVTIG